MRNTELTMAEYLIKNPNAIRIKSLISSDIQGMHSLLKKEGCLDSENKFTDEQKAIALDEVQTRVAQQNKTDKQASSDMLLCVDGNKYLLADAKFNSTNVKNISPTELKAKLSCSKSLVLSDDYTYVNAFYVLFKQSVLTPTQYNRLKRQFAGKPQFRFMNAIEFWKLFD